MKKEHRYRPAVRFPSPIASLFALCLSILAVPSQSNGGAAARGQAWDPASTGRPSFRIFTNKAGLPQNSINAMAFDSKGYLWVGTQDGAARYNGREWTVMSMPNRQLSNYVRALRISPDDSVWFGTDGGGVLHWKEGTWEAFDTKSGLPHNTVRALLETAAPDGTRRVWAGTSGGLALLQAGVWKSFTAHSGLPSDDIRTLLETRAPDGASVLWVGTNNGLVRWQSETWTLFNSRSGLPNDNIRSLLETRAPDGTPVLWVGTNGGLARLHEGKWSSFTTQSGLPNNIVLSLLETADLNGQRTLWAGTYGGGLAFWQKGVWKTINSQSGLPNNAVLSLLERSDKNGLRTLWAGTHGGLACWREGAWKTIDTRSGLANNDVLSLLETGGSGGDRSLWVGTLGGGLSRWQQGGWKTLDTRNGLPNNGVMCLLQSASASREAAIWIGTFGGGLVRLQNNVRTVFDTRSGLPNNTVLCLLETQSSSGAATLWAGTNGGLGRFQDGAWRAFTTRNGLPNDDVRSLLETVAPDGSRTLWVGTNGGLARWHDGVWTTFDTTSGLPNNTILGLLETTSGDGHRTLWVGTSGGVSRLDLTARNASWTTLSDSTQPALPNNTVYQIRQDAAKRIYLFTNQGIARLTPRTPTADNPAEFEIYTFTTEDGLPSVECYQGASMTDSQQRIWTGTNQGAAVFDPASEVPDRLPKPLLIEQALIHRKDEDQSSTVASPGENLTLRGENVVLAHNENNLTFEYALLCYYRERDTRYRTQLEGFDARGTEWTAEFKRAYTNLPSGTYAFAVWGKDYAGNVSGPVRISFSVRPAPWRTWWAFGLYIISALALVAGYIRIKTKAHERTVRVLDELVKHRTRQVEDKNLKLEQTLHQLQETQNQLVTQEKLASLGSLTAGIAHEIKNPLNFVNNFAGLMVDLSKELQEEIQNQKDKLDAESYHFIEEILGDIRQNSEKVREHGKRADSIVRSMLLHSRGKSGERQPTDVNTLLQEYVNLAYHGLRARDTTFNVTIESDYDPSVGLVDAVPQELSRVFLNIIHNACYSVQQKKKDLGEKFVPTLSISTRNLGDRLEIHIKDNGKGISAETQSKIFDPFFTTKPAGEGTGLGLSLSFEIIVQQHKGEIKVNTEEGEFAEFIIVLPRH